MKKTLVIFILLVSIQGCTGNDPALQYVSALRGLMLRAEPWIGGRAITLIPFRSQVTVVEKSRDVHEIDGLTGSWCKVQWNGRTGWVFGEYLKPLGRHERTFFLYNHIKPESCVKDEMRDQEFSFDLKKPRLSFPGYLKALPDVIIDSEVVVVDEKRVYTDFINTIVDDSYPVAGWLLSFDLKSGRKLKSAYHGGPLFIRKSRYDALSKELPRILDLKLIRDKDIEGAVYRELAKNKDEDFHLGVECYPRDKKLRDCLNCTVYEIPDGSGKNYLALLEEKSRRGYTSFCFIRNGRLVAAHNGAFICAFTIGRAIYFFCDSWVADTGWGGKMLFKCEDGDIEIIEKDFTHAV